jgi:hypothetical protein
MSVNAESFMMSTRDGSAVYSISNDGSVFASGFYVFELLNKRERRCLPSVIVSNTDDAEKREEEMMA